MSVYFAQMRFDPDFAVEVDDHGASATLVVRGDLDLATGPELVAEVTAAASGHQRVELDLSGVTFADSAGLHTVDELLGAWLEGDAELVVVAESDAVRRIARFVRAA